MQRIGRTVGFFGLLEPELRIRMEERARVYRLRKGQAIIESGARSTDVYFLVEGELRVLLYSPDGKEVSVRVLLPGQMFGELAAIDGLPRSATVVAVVPSVVVSITHADFLGCIRSAKTALWLAQQFAAQIRTLTGKIFELSALNVRSRLHCELLRLVTSSGTATNQYTLKPAPTHAELANRIGTHREAVTRELRALSKRGIVAQDRRSLSIRDVAALSRLVRHSSGADAQIYPAAMFARDTGQIAASAGP